MANLLAQRSMIVSRVSPPPRVVSAVMMQPLRPVRGGTSRQLGIYGVQPQVHKTLQPTRRRHIVAPMAGLQPMFETAFVMPGLAATLFRAATAGVGVYCLLQWRSLNSTRNQVEHIIEDNKTKSAERTERLKRLQPRTPPPSDDEDQAGA